LAPLRGAIWLRAARAKYLYQYRKVAVFCRLDRGPKVMPALVTPELTLVRVADKEALDKYATARTAAGARVNYLRGFCRS
jgi:hypothetical protein